MDLIFNPATAVSHHQSPRSHPLVDAQRETHSINDNDIGSQSAIAMDTASSHGLSLSSVGPLLADDAGNQPASAMDATDSSSSSLSVGGALLAETSPPPASPTATTATDASNEPAWLMLERMPPIPLIKFWLYQFLNTYPTLSPEEKAVAKQNARILTQMALAGLSVHYVGQCSPTMRVAARAHAQSARREPFVHALTELLKTAGVAAFGAMALTPALWHAMEAGSVDDVMELVECLKDDVISIEYFAKTRGIKIEDELTLDDQFAWDVKKGQGPAKGIRTEFLKGDVPIGKKHPHALIVPGKVPAGKHEIQPTWTTETGNGLELIDVNSWDPQAWEGARRPRRYPADYPFPPRADLGPWFAECWGCGALWPETCDCTWDSPSELKRPLVELRKYGVRGIGVRVLEPLPFGCIVDEYVGEVQPTDLGRESAYSYGVTDLAPPRRRCEVYNIDAVRKGNWTRFVNHSCVASCHFAQIVVGSELKVCIIAERDVEAFDELTVDYGMNYFGNEERPFCLCGEPTCKHPPPASAGDSEGTDADSWGTDEDTQSND